MSREQNSGLIKDWFFRLIIQAQLISPACRDTQTSNCSDGNNGSTIKNRAIATYVAAFAALHASSLLWRAQSSAACFAPQYVARWHRPHTRHA